MLRIVCLVALSLVISIACSGQGGPTATMLWPTEAEVTTLSYEG